MENRNIYKMDDVLIIVSYLMLLPTAYFAWPWLQTIQNATDFSTFILSAPVILGARFTGVLIYGAGALSSQIVGRIIRFKEKQSLKILDAMGYSGKTTVDQLSMTTGMSASRVRSLVKKLSKIPSVNITLKGDVVAQGSKNKSVYERPDYKVKEAPQSDPHSPVEPPPSHSEVPPEVQAIMKDSGLNLMQKMKKIQEFSKEHPDIRLHEAQSLNSLKSMVEGGSSRQASKKTEEGKKFHLLLFIILFMSPLWPIALIYAISFAVKQRKNFIPEAESVKKE